MDTHSKDLLYGTQPPSALSDDTTDVAGGNEAVTDESGSGDASFDLGQGGGEEHIRISKKKENDGKLGGGDAEPTAAFDEIGNPIPRPVEEDDEPVPLI